MLFKIIHKHTFSANSAWFLRLIRTFVDVPFAASANEPIVCIDAFRIFVAVVGPGSTFVDYCIYNNSTVHENEFLSEWSLVEEQWRICHCPALLQEWSWSFRASFLVYDNSLKTQFFARSVFLRICSFLGSFRLALKRLQVVQDKAWRGVNATCGTQRH